MWVHSFFLANRWQHRSQTQNPGKQKKHHSNVTTVTALINGILFSVALAIRRNFAWLRIGWISIRLNFIKTTLKLRTRRGYYSMWVCDLRAYQFVPLFRVSGIVFADRLCSSSVPDQDSSTNFVIGNINKNLNLNKNHRFIVLIQWFQFRGYHSVTIASIRFATVWWNLIRIWMWFFVVSAKRETISIRRQISFTLSLSLSVSHSECQISRCRWHCCQLIREIKARN